MDLKLKNSAFLSFFLMVLMFCSFSPSHGEGKNELNAKPQMSEELVNYDKKKLELLLEKLNDPEKTSELVDLIRSIILLDEISAEKKSKKLSIINRVKLNVSNLNMEKLIINSFKSLIIIFAAFILIKIIRFSLNKLTDIRNDLDIVEKSTSNHSRYIIFARKILTFMIFALSVLLVLKVFSIDIIDYFKSDFGFELAARFLTIIFVVIFSLILWSVISSAIDKVLVRTNLDQTGNRIRTLLPLARNALLILIIITSAIIILSELGVNIAPLLAGAGIIGLAIGFGAQTLVKDIITGAFIVFENTLAVGDVIEVAGHSGVVEGMTIRTIKLRDLKGRLHTIPFSSVDTIVNMTRDYSYVVSEIGVSYREDTDDVINIINNVFKTLRNDENYNLNIMDDLEVMGLERFDDSAVILKIRIKTKPGFQWLVKREFNRRIKYAFDENNIEIPYPHKTIYFGEDKGGNSPSANINLRKDKN